MSSTRFTSDISTVECHKHVRSWRLLRTLIDLLIPTCNNCTFVQESHHNPHYKPTTYLNSIPTPSSSPTSNSPPIFTGTFFGSKRGKVKFCVQDSHYNSLLLLLLQFAVPTSALAREMRAGLLRIALECTNTCTDFNNTPLLDTMVWRMYCNGRRVGFAVKRRPSKADIEVLERVSGVVVGAGVVCGKEVECEDGDVMYLRGNFERIRGSSDAESFHFIDPDGDSNQYLSIFFLRS